MILSFNSITFSPLPIWANSYPLLECARLIADIGYAGIEIIAGRPHAWPGDLRTGERRRIQREISNMGLKIVAVCPLIAPSYNPASLHAGEYKEAQDLVNRKVTSVKNLGIAGGSSGMGRLTRRAWRPRGGRRCLRKG